MRCTQATLEALGIHDRCPKNGLGVVDAILEAGYKIIVASGDRPIGLKDFIDSHLSGRYYLVSDEHAMALIDGQLTDTSFRRITNRIKVVGAVEILPPPL